MPRDKVNSEAANLEIELLAFVAKSEHLGALKAAEQLHRVPYRREHSAADRAARSNQEQSGNPHYFHRPKMRGNPHYVGTHTTYITPKCQSGPG